jgi:PAS domain S-box-containing protein
MPLNQVLSFTVLQMAVGLALALLLLVLHRTSAREEYLRFWSYAWFTTVFSLASGAASLLWVPAAGGTWAAVVLQANTVLSIWLAWLQPSWMVLATLALRHGRLSTRTVAAWLAVGTGAALATVLAGAATGPGAGREVITIAPRALAASAAMGLFAAALLRLHPRANTPAGRWTGAFCGLYAVHLLLFGLLATGIHLYPRTVLVNPSVMGALLPFAMTMGIVLMVLDQAAVAERRMELVWEGSLDGLRLTDEQGTIQRVNDAYCAVVGMTREQLEGSPLTVCYDPAIAGELMADYRRRVQGGAVEPRVSRQLPLWDGRTVWLALSNSVISSPSGPTVLSIIRDETKRREAEEALKVSEERQTLALETTSDAVYDWNLETGAVFTSQRYFRMLGYEPGELPLDRQAFLGLLHPDDYQTSWRSFTRQVRERGGRFSHEFRLRAKSGDYVWVLSTGKAVEQDAQGRAIRIVGTLTDVTALRRAEEERKGLEQQLAQAQRMEAVGRLAGGVAHDFNNLLTVINGYGSLALENLAEDDPIRDDLRQVCEAGRRAADLTQQLLTFSRRRVLEPRVIALNTVVSDAERMMRWIAGEDIALSVTLAPDARDVNADPSQIHQVLLNLVANARDAMPQGGTLAVSTFNVRVAAGDATGSRADVPPGDYVALAVADTGLGMDESVRTHIFEPFFTTKPYGRGTGLGLASVYGIVTQSRGQVTVESAPGAGTTMTVYLPVDDSESGGAEGAEEEVTWGWETVLLVEDEPEVRRFAAVALHRYGYTVLEAESGPAALALARAHEGPIHLLVTDVMMPGMKGPELADRLCATRPAVRVLYVSGYPDAAEVYQGPPPHGRGYLQKPFGPEALARKVRETLSGPAESGAAG